jgi:ribosomal protein S18 acetylase RimI-like enzyme
MTDFHVRTATATDAAALGRLGALFVRLHHDFDPQRFLPASPRTERGYGGFLASQIQDSDVVMLVAEREGQVIGYTYASNEGTDYMSLRGPAGVLHDIVVDPGHRALGVGRALLEATVAALGAKGAPRVVLQTAEKNAGAQRLFASAGFRTTMLEMTREV